MSVSLYLFLYGKPGEELNAEGDSIEAAQIRELRAYLSERLDTAANAIEKLTAAGWEASMTLYDVILHHPYVNTEAEARSRLDDLGLDPDLFLIIEDEEEEDFEEEDGLEEEPP
jgi:hypothetical protein